MLMKLFHLIDIIKLAENQLNPINETHCIYNLFGIFCFFYIDLLNPIYLFINTNMFILLLFH